MDEKGLSQKLPVFPTIKQAFAVPARDWRLLLQALLITGVCLAIVDLVSERAPFVFGPLTELGYIAIYGVAFTLFAVTCHRLILLGEGAVPAFGVLSWSIREWRFIGWMFVAYLYMAVVFAFVMMPFGLLASELTDGFEWLGWFSFIAILPAMYVFSRVSILFPAVAVEQRVGWDWAWDITKGNGWRLVVIVGVVPAVLGMIPAFLYGQHVLSDVLLTLVGLLLLVVEISALSLCFRFLMARETDSFVESRE